MELGWRDPWGQMFFRDFGAGSFDPRGHLRVIWGQCWKVKFLNRLQQKKKKKNWQSQCVAQCQPSKITHGEIFVRPVVKGQRSVQICFNGGLIFKQPSTTKLTKPVCWSMSTIEKCSWWPHHPACVKGSKVKIQICFNEGSNLKSLNIRNLTLPMYWSWLTTTKS